MDPQNKIPASEYDASYFDGGKQAYTHNAGYSKYERWYRHEGENSSGEFWKDKAIGLFNDHNLANKKVLDLGCAKGFIVQDLRKLGVDAYGLDVSPYAISEAELIVQPYLTVGDARLVLSKYQDNEFDVVLSLRTLECFSEAELPSLIAELNRISVTQIHIIDESGNENFYLLKPILWWQSLGFQAGATLISRESNKALIK